MGKLDSLFARPQQLIDWAKAALAEAQTASAAFFCDKNFPLVSEVDRKTGDVIVRVYLAVPIPSEIPRKLTEGLNNARHSFDQSVFAACAAIGQPIKDGYYPWASNPDPDLARRLVGNNHTKPKIPRDLWDVIRAQEPYPRGDGYTGGHDGIRAIAKLANSKHTVGVEIGAAPTRSRLTNVSLFVPQGSSLIGPARWDPVKNEIILWRGGPGVELDFDCSMEFEIRLRFPEGTENAGRALGVFIKKAQSVLDGLKARAIELGAT